jgi:hypothetical protein
MSVVWDIVFVAIVGWFFVCVIAYVVVMLAFGRRDIRKPHSLPSKIGQRPRLLGRWPK